MGGGLGFLHKKGFHTGSMQNQERVWKAEQQKMAEDAKLEEIKKQIAEERQVMELQDVMQVGRDAMKATDDAIERSKKTVETTIQLGQQTAEALRNQTEQMERVVDDLDEIHFSLKKSFKVIRDLTRGLATDKCILALLFLVVAGVVAIIAVKIAGFDENDEVIDVDPLNSQNNAADSAARRMHRRMLFDDGEARDTRTGLWL